MKNTLTKFIHIAVIVATTLTLPSIGLAQKGGDSRKDVEARLEERYRQLLKAQNSGKVGETTKGFVEAVDPKDSDNQLQKLIEDENADRRRLYEILAAEDKAGKNVTVADVGERNAIRKFQKADGDHYLKVSGEWVQKRDVSRLKKEGVIGETWEGYVAAVPEGDKADAKAKAVIILENTLRRDDYQRQARKQDSSLKQIAEKNGADNLRNVPAGQWYLPEGGKWMKK